MDRHSVAARSVKTASRRGPMDKKCRARRRFTIVSSTKKAAKVVEK
jgi:hypothetical protein